MYLKKKESAFDMKNKCVMSSSSQQRLRKSTIRWKLEVSWRDGSSAQMQIKDLKQSNTAEVAKFLRASDANNNPDFAWWVHQTFQ